MTRAAQVTDYLNADGSHSAVLSSVPVNYRTPVGVWQPIDNTLMADPDRAGGFVNSANSWQAHFGTTAQGFSVDTPDGSLDLRPLGARLTSGLVSAAGDGLTYAEAWPGVDLAYTVTGAGVKESVLIKTRAAAASFGFAVRSGSKLAVLQDRGANDSPVLMKHPDGSVTPAGVLAGDLRIETPRVERADGEPVEDAHATLSASTGRLVLAVDPRWLAAQPDSAFPINLDPSLTSAASTSESFKSDGFSCSSCGVQFGNSRDGGDTMWRTVTRFPYESLFGDEILGSALSIAWQSGTANDYGMRVFWATSYTFAGSAGHPTVLAAAQPGSGGTSITGAALSAQVKSWIDNRVSGAALGFVGDEEAGLYTYQNYTMQLVVGYNYPPSAPTGVGFNHAYPTTPGCTGGTIDGTQPVVFKATLGAPSTRNLKALYDYWDAATPTMISTAPSGTYTSASPAGTWTASFAPNVFKDGHNYYFKVQGSDGVKTGPWSGNCAFHVTDPVASSPTNPGFGPTNPGLACGSVVRGDQVIVLEATIKAATAQSQVRANFTVTYGTHAPQTYTTPYVAYNAAGTLAQISIAANTPVNPSVFSIPNGTAFTWSVTAQTASDGKNSAPTNCSGSTSSGQVPSPVLQSDDLDPTSPDGGNVGVGGIATVNLSDSDPDVTEYVWSYQDSLPAPLPGCDTQPDNNYNGIGVTCSGDPADANNNSFPSITVVPPRTSFSLTVWAVDQTGTVSPPVTVTYTVADLTTGELSHLWQTDVTSDSPASVADVLDPDNAQPLALNAGVAWAADGAPWEDTAGSDGSVLHFDGSSGAAVTTDPAVPLNTGDNVWDQTDDFSVQAWVRPAVTSGATFSTVLGQDGDQISGFKLGMSSGNWQFCMPTNQEQPGDGTYDGDCASIPQQSGYVNSWTLLSGVWDATSGQIRLFVTTGLSAGPQANPSTSMAQADHPDSAQGYGEFTVGRGEQDGAPAEFWQGDIEDPMAYTGVIDSTVVGFAATYGPASSINP